MPKPKKFHITALDSIDVSKPTEKGLVVPQIKPRVLSKLTDLLESKNQRPEFTMGPVTDVI